MTHDPFVPISEIMPPRFTCCWVKLVAHEGPVPAMWDGQKWNFQLKAFNNFQVTEWKVNTTGCWWYDYGNI